MIINQELSTTHQNPFEESRIRRVVAGTLGASFFIVALIYSAFIPLYESPDEVGNIRYVLDLRTSGTLPVQEMGIISQAHHPPLYYLFAALVSLPADVNDLRGSYRPNPEFMWGADPGKDINASLHGSAETFPYQGQALFAHLVRLTSVIFSTATVLTILYLGWRIFPAYPAIGILAAILTAFNPGFLFISASASPDALLTLAITVVIWHFVILLSEPQRTQRWFWIGVWVAIGTLTKTNALLFGALAGGVLLFFSLRQRSLAFLLRNGTALALPAIIGTGWWFARNWVLYDDLVGMSYFSQNYRSVFRAAPLTTRDLQHFFTMQMNSFWGLFGWGNVWAPHWFYDWIRIVFWAAAAGLVFAWFRFWRVFSAFQQQALGLFVMLALGQEIYMLIAITRFDDSWYHGRYVYPVMASLTLLAGLGLFSLQPRRFVWPLTVMLSVLFLGIALFMPLRVIGPIYAAVPQAKWTLWFAPNHTVYEFDGQIALRGYATEIRDQRAVVRLYWQALGQPDFNYSAFVHVVDESGVIQAQSDRAPGEDRGYPPSVWQLGDIVADESIITLPPGLEPATMHLIVGLYNWETGERLPLTAGATGEEVRLKW